MAWITDLADLFSHSNVNEIQMQKLANRFKDKDADVMTSAIDLYIEENEYFPSIARFKPYVETAEYMQTAKSPRYQSMTDDDRFRIEVERGTMRPLVEIIDEIAAARIQLRQVRQELKEVTA